MKSEWKGHFPEYHFGILGVPRELVSIFRKIGITGGAFHSTKNSGYSGWGSEWNRHFPEFHSEILGVPREVGLKFRKIGITGKYCSIRHMEYPNFLLNGKRPKTQPRCGFDLRRLREDPGNEVARSREITVPRLRFTQSTHRSNSPEN